MGVLSESTHCVEFVRNSPLEIIWSKSSSNSQAHVKILYKKDHQKRKIYKRKTPASQQRDDSFDPEILEG